MLTTKGPQLPTTYALAWMPSWNPDQWSNNFSWRGWFRCYTEGKKVTTSACSIQRIIPHDKSSGGYTCWRCREIYEHISLPSSGRCQCCWDSRVGCLCWGKACSEMHPQSPQSRERPQSFWVPRMQGLRRWPYRSAWLIVPLLQHEWSWTACLVEHAQQWISHAPPPAVLPAARVRKRVSA